MAIISLKDFLKKGARTILPKELEYRTGLTKRPMEFKIGEGLTPEQKIKAKEIVRKPAIIPLEGFLAGALRAFPRGAARLGVELGGRIIGKEAEIKTRTPLEEFVFGKEPIKG